MCHWAVRHAVLHIVVVMILRRWRFLVDDTKFVFVIFQVLIAVIADFAVRACFMCAAMSKIGVSTISLG